MYGPPPGAVVVLAQPNQVFSSAAVAPEWLVMRFRRGETVSHLAPALAHPIRMWSEVFRVPLLRPLLLSALRGLGLLGIW